MNHTLDEFLERGWADHADDAAAVAARLPAGEALLAADDGNVAGFVRLASHTLLAHLGDLDAARAWLARLAPRRATGAQSAEALDRLAASVALTAGEPSPAVAPGVLLAAHQSAVLALDWRCEHAQAAALLTAAEQLARDDETLAQPLAVMANGAAFHLRYWGERSPTRDALTIAAAELARRAWARAGSWQEVERADYMLALCHAVAQQPQQALAYAQACMDACRAHEADAYELFFAHEALARAYLAQSARAQAAAEREHMLALLPQVAEGEDRAYCERALAALAV